MSGFTINKDYAEKYNKWRQKEELQKLKNKYGDVESLSESSSSDETEDEDAEALNPRVEKDWLRTLAALKSKDPKIYEKDFKFYHSDDEEETEPRVRKKKKPMFLKDYERKVLLEKDGHVSSDSEDVTEDVAAKKPGYFEEQEEIRKSFLVAVSDDESDDNEGLLSQREKTQEEQSKEEEEYLKWLKGQKDSLQTEKQVGVELEPLKSYWDNPELDSGEKFLKDFILNKRYLDGDDDERIPTYEEVVDSGQGLFDDEEILEKQEEFERKYNFRYEEPDEEFIKSYPRTIGDSLRRKDTRRAEKRQEIRERKKREKEKKKEEIKQLKNLKKREIADKLEKLKEITGNQDLGFNEDDLNDDFDPKKHDEMMKKYFNEEYYHHGDEEQKPDFIDEGDEDLITENWDNWTGHEEIAEEAYVDDPNFVMDCDFDPTQVVSKKQKKKKKSTKFAEAINKTKPEFDPNEKTFEEYFDEYYKLDYEDIIGDMPCRFRYRQVPNNDYGLNVNEILTCKDKELNAWASLKKMSQYRTKEEEENDIRIFKAKAKNLKKKQNVLVSLVEEQEKKEAKQGKHQEMVDRLIRKDRSKKMKKKKQQDFDSVVYKRTLETESEGMLSTSQTGKKNKVNEESDDNLSSSKKRKRNLESDSVESLSPKEKKHKVKSNSGKNPVGKKDKVKVETNIQTKTPVGKKDKVKVETLVTSPVTDIESVQDKVDDSNMKIKAKLKQVSNTLPAKLQEENKITADNGSSAMEGVQKKRKRKNKKKNPGETVSKTPVVPAEGKKRKRGNKKREKPAVTDERLLAYGINPKKFKFMKIKKLNETVTQ